MSLNIRDFDTMVEAILDRIILKYPKFTQAIKRPESVLRIIIEAIVDEIDSQGYYLGYAYDSVDFDNAVGEEIDRMIKILGVYRDGATYGNGIARFCRNSPAEYDIPIYVDTVVSTQPDQDSNVIEFTTTETKILLTGQTYVDVPIKAVNSGVVYVPIGLINIIPKPVTGIDYVTNTIAVNDGKDIESDDSLKERTRLARAGLGKATASAIEFALRELDFVLDAKTEDMVRGTGTTDVLVVCTQMPPTQDMQNKISTVVMATKASGINALVKYPTILLQNISYTVVFGSSDTELNQRNAIGKATLTYFSTLGVSEVLYKNQLIKVSLESNKSIIDLDTITPTGNITPTSEQCIRVGTITINGEVWTIG